MVEDAMARLEMAFAETRRGQFRRIVTARKVAHRTALSVEALLTRPTGTTAVHALTSPSARSTVALRSAVIARLIAEAAPLAVEVVAALAVVEAVAALADADNDCKQVQKRKNL